SIQWMVFERGDASLCKHSYAIEGVPRRIALRFAIFGLYRQTEETGNAVSRFADNVFPMD
ncbi:MAG: hypothetical protein IKS42_04025, partial [Oscillospiraceae bacterium]|nr:hypothetical protein [Oscillospiraceae bacterium]